MNVAILDDHQDVVRHLACYKLLEGHRVQIFREAPAPAALSEVEALVLIRERTRVTEALLAQLPRLRLISQTGKASGHIDVAAATAHRVAIAEGVGDPVAPAELTWALVLAASRKLLGYASQLRSGRWQHASAHAAHDGLGVRLAGRTLGIWGCGRIGRRVAGYGRAFGMEVVVWGREGSRKAAAAEGLRFAASKEALFDEADVLSLHLRLTPETRGCVGPDDLARMGRSSLLVNTSRSELIASGALEAALLQGRPGGAALDVFESEPLLPTAPLLAMDNVLCTPHLGYVEQHSYELYFGAAFQNVVDFARGVPQNLLNPDVLG
jgi:D-3-phosphoglycerate dehydrogenase